MLDEGDGARGVDVVRFLPLAEAAIADVRNADTLREYLREDWMTVYDY